MELIKVQKYVRLGTFNVELMLLLLCKLYAQLIFVSGKLVTLQSIEITVYNNY